jgi:HD-GYP domain-containing protein (c-di-GMP phosphodiesterase class II)
MGSKDFDSQEHGFRVAGTAYSLGRLWGLRGAELDDLYHAGTLHDVGKIAIPERILFKPGLLDRLETRAIRLHPVIGEGLVRALHNGPALMPMVRHHHERMDGRGYPDGLSQGGIPLGARIIAICDSFDAMINDRPYRPGRSLDYAVGELAAGAGSQWDADLVRLFLHEVAELFRLAS